MTQGHTTTFRINGADFFVANLDNGGVRIGLKGSACLDVPPTHELHEKIIAIESEAQAEEFFYDVAAPLILKRK